MLYEVITHLMIYILKWNPNNFYQKLKWRTIKGSSDETAKIIKTIDEIAFQTNLLAFRITSYNVCYTKLLRIWWPYKCIQTPFWHCITGNNRVSIPPGSFFLHFPKCNDGGSWGGWNVSTVIPTLQRLDIGSIQHLMTCKHMQTQFWHHFTGNIHVSLRNNFV